MVFMTVPFIRKNTQRNSSWPGDSTLHTKAEYICADLSLPSSLFPLQSEGGHTFMELRDATCPIGRPSSKWKVPHWKSVNPSAFIED
jgi:hypothetical protein